MKNTRYLEPALLRITCDLWCITPIYAPQNYTGLSQVCGAYMCASPPPAVHNKDCTAPPPCTSCLRAPGIEPRRKKGLRVRNSPTCTLSQNGYGGFVGKPRQLLTKSPLPCDVLVRSQPCAINSLYAVANHSSIQIRALETEIVDVFQIQCFFTRRSCGQMDQAPPS